VTKAARPATPKTIKVFRFINRSLFDYNHFDENRTGLVWENSNKIASRAVTRRPCQLSLGRATLVGILANRPVSLDENTPVSQNYVHSARVAIPPRS
jgi:hypothetical protein